MTETQKICLKGYDEKSYITFPKINVLKDIEESYKCDTDSKVDDPGTTLCFIYMIAYENVLDKRVFKALNEFDSDYIIKSFLNNELFALAHKQRKTTQFKQITRDFFSLRKKNRKNQIIANPSLSFEVVENILDDFDIYVRNNLITKRTEITGPGADKYIYSIFSEANADIGLTNLVYDECHKRNVKYSSGKGAINMISFFLEAIADKNRYNPLLEMFSKYKNDNEEYFNMLVDILNLNDEFDILLLKKWLIQCVALAHNEYHSNLANTEGILTLQGPQAIGKTNFFKKLAVESDWFVEGVELDTSNKDSKITVLSCWITELGELDATLRKNQPSLKSFITNSMDRIRFPFARKDTLIPRTTSICATVNPKHFLKDETGNHRYWILGINEIDTEKLFSLEKETIKMLWGYIYSLYLVNPNSYRLSKSELDELNKRNIEYNELLPYEMEISGIFDFSIPTEEWIWYTPTEISTAFPNHMINAERVGKVLSKLMKTNPKIEFQRNSLTRKYLVPPINKFLH